MGRTPLTVTVVDKDVSSILELRRVEIDMSYRQLSKDADVSLSRLHAILKAERSMTVGELESISEVLGLVGWKVLREAGEPLRPAATVTDLSALRSRLEAGEYGDVAALDPGYSARAEEGPEMP